MLNLMFSDDTSFFYSHSNMEDLFKIADKEIKRVFEWYSMNKLSPNADKANKKHYALQQSQ